VGIHWRRRGDGPQNASLRPALGKPVAQSAGDRALFPALATLTSKAGCRYGLNRPLIGPTALKTPLYAVALACIAARALAQTPAPTPAAVDPQRAAEVDRRGDQAMGFSPNKSQTILTTVCHRSGVLFVKFNLLNTKNLQKSGATLLALL
jgi:hypothetical protein